MANPVRFHTGSLLL